MITKEILLMLLKKLLQANLSGAEDTSYWIMQI